jgi:hypothetical protein
MPIDTETLLDLADAVDAVEHQSEPEGDLPEHRVTTKSKAEQESLERHLHDLESLRAAWRHEAMDEQTMQDAIERVEDAVIALLRTVLKDSVRTRERVPGRNWRPT